MASLASMALMFAPAAHAFFDPAREYVGALSNRSRGGCHIKVVVLPKP